MHFHQSIYVWLSIMSAAVVCASQTAISDGNNKFKENVVLRDEDNVLLDKTVATGNVDALSLEDQVHLLKNQMSALMNQRREDYKMLENSLKKTVKKNSMQLADLDLKAEVIQLRQEIKAIRKASSSNKERLTVEWLSESITELRTELSELQEASSNASRNSNRPSAVQEDLFELRNDFTKLKLEIEAIKLRQESTERLVKELQSEAVQRDEDLRKSSKFTAKNGDMSEVRPEADHRMRHKRFLRQQLHDIDATEKYLKRQLNELQHHHIGERLRNLETEHHRLANANFNLSRQVTSLEKLHGSMLELLEDIESIQNKLDKTIPDIKREISKVEFNAAQLSSEQSLLREEGHNAVKSIQAMAVSISTLQDERDEAKQFHKIVEQLQQDVQKIKSASSAHQDFFHGRIQKIEADSKHNSTLQSRTVEELQMATNLIKQLETVELQYESIVNKLPNDCSEVQSNADGLYLIAPAAAQQRPIMTHCTGQWMTIQRRFDGSVDFNRSWDEYAQGFGRPSGEFYIGNDVLHHLTGDNCSSLRILMEDIYDNIWLAEYNVFGVASRENGYRLTIAGYKGNASDAFDYQNNMEFSAIDVDRDISNTHCAGNYEGGWWFSHCQHANLNGRYNLGLTWFDSSRNEWIAVKSSHMMVARRHECSTVIPTPGNDVTTKTAAAATTTTTTTTDKV